MCKTPKDFIFVTKSCYMLWKLSRLCKKAFVIEIPEVEKTWRSYK